MSGNFPAFIDQDLPVRQRSGLLIPGAGAVKLQRRLQPKPAAPHMIANGGFVPKVGPYLQLLPLVVASRCWVTIGSVSGSLARSMILIMELLIHDFITY